MHKLICLGLALLALPVRPPGTWTTSRRDSVSSPPRTLPFRKSAASGHARQGRRQGAGAPARRAGLGEHRHPLRDERIREHLFETKRFAEAEITAQLDLAPIVELADGVQLEMRQPVTVSLHGKRKSYASDLLVTRLDEHRFRW